VRSLFWGWKKRLDRRVGELARELKAQISITNEDSWNGTVLICSYPRRVELGMEGKKEGSKERKEV